MTNSDMSHSSQARSRGRTKTHPAQSASQKIASQAEVSLYENEARYRNVFEGVQDAIFVETPSGQILDVNQRACEMFGYTRQEFLGKTVKDLVPSVENIVLVNPENTGSAPDRPVETINVRADGTQFPIEISVRIQKINGEFVFFVVGRDITERKRSEEKLARQASELAQRNDELDRLYRASGSLMSRSSFNLQELAQKIVEIVQKEFGQANCSLLILHRDSNELLRLAAAGPYSDQIKNKKLTLDGPGLVPQAIRTGEKINVGDVRSIPGYLSNWEPARSELTIPLKIGNVVIGAIDVQSLQENAFGPDDERLMSIFSERAALALEHSRLNVQTEERMQQLLALRTIDMAISSSFDLSLTLGILLDQVTRLLGITRCRHPGFQCHHANIYFFLRAGFPLTVVGTHADQFWSRACLAYRQEQANGGGPGYAYRTGWSAEIAQLIRGTICQLCGHPLACQGAGQGGSGSFPA